MMFVVLLICAMSKPLGSVFVYNPASESESQTDVMGGRSNIDFGPEDTVCIRQRAVMNTRVVGCVEDIDSDQEIYEKLLCLMFQQQQIQKDKLHWISSEGC